MIRNGLEPMHLLVLFAIIMLVFGGRKLPEMARGMGQGLRIFKAELRGLESDMATGQVDHPVTADGHVAPGSGGRAQGPR